MKDRAEPISTKRLRIGIIIWLLSWMPFPTLVVHTLHNSGHVESSKATSATYAVLWGAQICIGLFGLWLAGKETLGLVKSAGWRGTPKRLWQVVWRGNVDFET